VPISVVVEPKGLIEGTVEETESGTEIRLRFIRTY